MCAYAGRTCAVCSKPYRPSYGDQRTCGRVCGALVKAPRPKAAKPVQQLTNCCSCAAEMPCHRGRSQCSDCRPGSRYVKQSGQLRRSQCKHCGTDIVEPIRMGRSRIRCADCAVVRNKAAAKAAKYRRRARMRIESETIVPGDLFQRDNYECKLCNEPLDMLATVPEPLAPTVDHITPLAKGGHHIWANVQSAHFLCNSRKSDR